MFFLSNAAGGGQARREKVKLAGGRPQQQFLTFSFLFEIEIVVGPAVVHKDKKTTAASIFFPSFLSGSFQASARKKEEDGRSGGQLLAAGRGAAGISSIPRR